MTSQFLATIYPGGALAVLSAILWLLLTVLAPITLLIGCVGLCGRFVGCSFAIKSLRLANWAAIIALLLLTLESCLVGWDAFFLLEDKAYFFEQFPANFKRAAANLIVLGISLLLYQAAQRKAALVQQAND